MAATRGTKLRAKRMHEKDGLSFTQIGRVVGFSAPAVGKWAKEEGWVKAGTNAVSDRAAELDAEALDLIEDARTVPEPPAPSVPDRSEAELRKRLAALEARNVDLEAENQKLKPTVDIQEYLDDRVKWLTDNSPEGERFWLSRAESKFKSDNIQRAKEGLPGFNISDHPDILDDLINELKTKEAMERLGEPDEPASRKVKLYIHRKGQLPVIEQIPMESQINNMAGSLADGIIRYTRKGFKLTDPMLCPRAGCFQPSASDSAGRWLFDAYCKELHRNEVEGDQKSPTVGLQTRDVMSGVV